MHFIVRRSTSICSRSSCMRTQRSTFDLYHYHRYYTSAQKAICLSSESTSAKMDSGPCASASSKSASVVDLISQSFPEFDHRGTIVEPFDNEGKRDGQFQDGERPLSLFLSLAYSENSTKS